MFLWESLRYRPLQSLMLLGVSALIGTCAAFGPLFARAVEQSITTHRLSEQRAPASILITGEVARPDFGYDASDLERRGRPAPEPEAMDRVRSQRFADLWERPVFTLSVNAGWLKQGQRYGDISAPMTWIDGLCEHLEIVAGRCPGRSGEVAVSVGRPSRRLSGDTSRLCRPRRCLAEFVLTTSSRSCDGASNSQHSCTTWEQ